MSIANKSSYDTKISAPWRRVNDTKNTLTTVAGRYYSNWLSTPDAGAAPTTAAVPTNATNGAIGQNNNGPGVQRLASIIASTQNPGSVVIVDRLSHQGGLSGTTITAQSTNLPTAALTRYTSGVGVMAALEIYSAVGTTGTTVTASYTNTVPTSGQTSLATVFGGTGFREAGRLIMLPPVPGDLGVTAVATVTVLASTLTAGNFGVTLFKPLAVLPSPTPGAAQTYDLLWTMGFIPEIPDNSCLVYHVLSNLASTGFLQTSHSFIED